MRSGFQECLRGVVILVDCGHVQWGEAVGVGLVDVVTFVDRLTDSVLAASDGRLVKRSASHEVPLLSI
jgi:hypothetical protein